MIYTIPYVLLIVFYGVLAVVYQQTAKDSIKNNTIYLSLFTFIIFFGCRGFVCDDLQSYYPAFQNCSIEYVNYNLFKYNIKWQDCERKIIYRKSSLYSFSRRRRKRFFS